MQFSTLLSETINASRLSGTKVKTLTELFTTSLDVSQITTFYKLNRSLPQGGQARISSLYIFDALSRGAKEGLKGKKKVEAKRCLDALEAVAESWVEGMTTSGGQVWVEGKVAPSIPYFGNELMRRIKLGRLSIFGGNTKSFLLILSNN
jgi:hypothetical protein